MRSALRLRSLGQSLGGSLWFLPTLSVTGAALLAALLTRVTVDQSLLAALVFTGGVDGARSVLEVVAGSVITVTSLVFSLTIVTLQLASSQFSPRLLSTFLRDRGNQIVLSVFLSTFAYSLTVLRTIHAGDDQRPPFVPDLAVSVAFLLVGASLAALVYFINHITQQIRVDTMMRDVEEETRRTIDRVHPDPLRPQDKEPAAPRPPQRAVAVPAPRSGFVQDTAAGSLCQVACEQDLVLRLHAAVGEQVVEGAPLAWAWTREEAAPAPDVDRLRTPVGDAVQVGHERTPQQDVAFGLRQLVDIAAKALSPGVNDPTTAVHAVGHLASLLGVLAGRRLQPLLRHDEEGVLRVAVARPDFAAYLDLACGQVRRYGADEPAVTTALLWLLREVASCTVTDEQRLCVAEQCAMALAAAERETDEPRDLSTVREAAEAVSRAVAGNPRP